MTLYFVKKISFRNTKECFVAKIGPGLVINPTDGHTVLAVDGLPPPTY